MTWQQDARGEAEPNWINGVPWCSDEHCKQYDGKRCGLTGFRPTHICEPTVIGMSKLLTKETNE